VASLPEARTVDGGKLRVSGSSLLLTNALLASPSFSLIAIAYVALLKGWFRLKGKQALPSVRKGEMEELLFANTDYDSIHLVQ